MGLNNAYVAGEKLLCGGYSEYTPTGKAYFVKNNRYGKVPHIGDIVYFYHSSIGRVAHVGIVIAVEKDGNSYSIKTVEGNTSTQAYERNGGGVAIKAYKFTVSDVGGVHTINGFGTPRFSEDTCSAAWSTRQHTPQDGRKKMMVGTTQKRAQNLKTSGH